MGYSQLFFIHYSATCEGSGYAGVLTFSLGHGGMLIGMEWKLGVKLAKASTWLIIYVVQIFRYILNSDLEIL